MIRTHRLRSRQLSMQDIPLHGSLAGIFFPRLLARLHAEGFDGTLRVSTGTILKVIYFKRGEIASAASNAEGDRLPSILIQDGRLTQPQLEMARSHVTPEKSLGKAFIEMGFLTPSELLQGARRQVRQILASCFRLRDGTYQIENGLLPAEVTVLGLPTRRLVFDALMEASDHAVTVREIGSMESVYRPVDDLEPRLASLKLEAAMERLARMFDGHATLRDLSGGTSLDDFTVGRVALALEILGLLETVEAREPSPSDAPTSRVIPIETIASGEPPAPLAGEAMDESTQEDDRTPAEAWASSGTDPEGQSEPARGSTAVEDAAPARDQGDTEPVREDASGSAAASDDMPPIPAEDLPAFARSEDEPPEWSVDPQTGDKVHFGPIEMTFDGRVRATPESSSRLGRLVGYAALALLAIVSALWIVTRRGAGAGGGMPVKSATERPTSPSVVNRTEPQRSPHAPGGDRPAAADRVPAAKTPAAAPSDQPPQAKTTPNVPAAQESPEGDQVATPVPAPAPPVPPQAAPPDAASVGFSDAARAGPALLSFEAGEFGDAAAKFQDLIAGEPADRVTLQLMIACEAETLRTARERAGRLGLLFVLPITLKDRSCYRACWGVYASKEGALAAVPELPPAFAGAGLKPIVVPLARLRPAP